MHILKVLFIILEVVLLFNLLILVHEWGHFLAARWRGLVVERFGIWFGKPLWQKKINGVVYCLGSIPAGGYVALPQMASMETIEGKTENSAEALPPISPLDKIIVAFAGPLFSFGLAFLFAVIVWMIGRPVSETETTTVIGYVVKDSPAEKAGLQPGDKILSVDGASVSRYSGIGDSITWHVVRSEGETLPVTVERKGKVMTFYPKPEKEKTGALERAGLRQIKILPKQTAMIGKVYPNSPAQKAGLKPSDIIEKVNGTKIYSPETVSDVIRDHPDQPLDLVVKRRNKTFGVSVQPVMPEGVLNNPDIDEENKIPRLGIGWDRTGEMTLAHPSPFKQIKASVVAMTSSIGAVIDRKSDIKAQHLSGPVGIMRIYYLLFESDQGWRLAIWFSVVLNVNLALLNLLPIPVLDGGHITLAIVEGIRRKPVNVRVLNFIQSACALLIIGYMLYVTFYDVTDLPWKAARTPAQQEIKFSPPNSSRNHP